MLIKATAKETKNPKAKKIIWSREKLLLLFKRSNPVAANIVGTARRNENSTIVFLLGLEKDLLLSSLLTVRGPVS